MRRLGLNTAVRRIVGVALASSVGAAGYACNASSDASSSDGGAIATDGDGGSDGDAKPMPFADEATFACDAPLPPILDNLTLPTVVDYLELRNQSWIHGADGGASGPTAANATHGTPCATAADHAACAAALAAVVLEKDADGWETNGDIDGPWAGGYPTTKQLLVYTRGDQVTALRSPAEVTAFLGTIDTLEEARLVLQTMNLPLACTTRWGKTGWRMNADGSWELLIANQSCGTLSSYRVRYVVTKEGVVTRIARESPNQCGRRPEGLREERIAGGGPIDLAAHFAQAAHLEAASVIAFRRLELELRRFGAPASFAKRAQRARADEINHARDTARLARRFGGVVPAVDVAPVSTRDIFAFALENAVEGAVRETYGALVAAFQAERATPELRPLFRRIARDEARHAELAHDIDRWAHPKLSLAERARLATARAAALEELRIAITREPEEQVARIAGMPNAREARVLLDGLDRELLATG